MFRAIARTGFGVALEAQHNLGRTVPSRGDVLRHVSGILLGVDGKATGKAKVADLELAVGVNEQVAGLQVSVEDVGGVDVLETAQDLVDEGLEVGVGQGLAGSDNGRQVALHQLCKIVSLQFLVALPLFPQNRSCARPRLVLTFVEVCLVEVVGSRNVHIVETCDLYRPVRVSACILQQKDPFVTHVAVAAKVLQQLDLAQGALGEDLLAEDIGDFLDGDALVRLVVDCRAVVENSSLAKVKPVMVRSRSWRRGAFEEWQQAGCANAVSPKL